MFTALATSPALDDHLCQVDCLRSLFVALNDEEFPVRAQAIQVQYGEQNVACRWCNCTTLPNAVPPVVFPLPWAGKALQLRCDLLKKVNACLAPRRGALQVTGRLADRNPAYVMPALRRHLVHLLTNMEHSPDSRNREESARLLGCLIQSAPSLIMPYVSPILKVRPPASSPDWGLVMTE